MTRRNVDPSLPCAAFGLDKFPVRAATWSKPTPAWATFPAFTARPRLEQSLEHLTKDSPTRLAGNTIGQREHRQPERPAVAVRRDRHAR